MPQLFEQQLFSPAGSAEGYDSRERRGNVTACHVFSQVPSERWPSRAWSRRPSMRWRCRPWTARVKAKAAPPTSSTQSPSVSGSSFILGSAPKSFGRPLDFVFIRALPEVALVSEGGKKKPCWSHLLIGGEREKTFVGEKKKKKKTLHAGGQLNTSQQWGCLDSVTMVSKTFHSRPVPADLSRSETDHSH